MGVPDRDKLLTLKRMRDAMMSGRVGTSSVIFSPKGTNP
jgi:hypothetical protein